jgi:geranylgeranyl reductase family protein
LHAGIYFGWGNVFLWNSIWSRMMGGLNSSKDADIAIIGAGPIGSYTAWRLAKLGYSVKIFEEHPEAGRPEQCAGLVNRRMFELPGLDGILDAVNLHEIIGADIFSPSGKSLKLRAGKVKAISMDRALFDKMLLRNAVEEGADLDLMRKVVSIIKKENGFELQTTGIGGRSSMTCNWLIGCDGSSSIMPRDLSFDRPLSVIPGVAIQVEIDQGKVPQDLVAVFTGEETAKGFFAWAVPAGGPTSMRIGLAAESGEALNRGYRSLFHDERLKEWLGTKKTLFGKVSLNFGPVPMGSPRKIIDGRALIIGDAAGMAKPTSGGGIYPGLMAVNDLANAIENEGELDQNALEGFRTSWLTGYGKELDRSRFFRRIISQVKDDEVEEVVDRLSDPELMNIINEEGDIDHPLRLALLLIRKDPTLLKLIPRFLPHMRRLI